MRFLLERKKFWILKKKIKLHLFENVFKKHLFQEYFEKNQFMVRCWKIVVFFPDFFFWHSPNPTCHFGHMLKNMIKRFFGKLLSKFYPVWMFFIRLNHFENFEIFWNILKILMKLFSYFFICNFLHISHQILAIFLEMFAMEYFCPIDVMRLGSTPLVATVSGLMTIVVYCDLFLMISEMVGCFNLSLLSKKWSHFFYFLNLNCSVLCFCFHLHNHTSQLYL